MRVVHVEANRAKQILDSSVVGIHPIDEIFVSSPNYDLHYIREKDNS